MGGARSDSERMREVALQDEANHPGQPRLPSTSGGSLVLAPGAGPVLERVLQPDGLHRGLRAGLSASA